MFSSLEEAEVECSLINDCHGISFQDNINGDHFPMDAIFSKSFGNGITNAYGRTKFMIEEIIKDIIRRIS